MKRVSNLVGGLAWLVIMCLFLAALPKSEMAPLANEHPSPSPEDAAEIEVKPHGVCEHAGLVNHIAFSPDGSQLAVAGSNHVVEIWDVDTQEQLHSQQGHTSLVNWLSFSSDGELLVSGSHDATARIWRMKDGKELHCLKGHSGYVIRVGFAPKSKLVAVAALGPDGNLRQSGQLKLWDCDTGKEIASLEGHTGAVYQFAFSPDGKKLASVSFGNPFEKLSGEAKTWSIPDGKKLATFGGHKGIVDLVAMDPKGEQVFTAGYDETVRVWEAAAAKEVDRLDGPGLRSRFMSLSHDGNLLVTGSATEGEVVVWDCNTRKSIISFRGHARRIQSAGFFRNRNLLWVASGANLQEPGDVRIWDLKTAKLVATLELEGPVLQAELSAKDDVIATLSLKPRKPAGEDKPNGKGDNQHEAAVNLGPSVIQLWTIPDRAK